MEILIIFALWIPSMAYMYKQGFMRGSEDTMDWMEKNGYIEFDENGEIK
jgi:hypothetical protein